MSEQDGLIGAYVLDGKGGGRELSWQDIEQGTPENAPVWLHMDRNGERTEDWLRQKSGLKHLHVDALLAGETRPRVAFMDDGILMTLRGVNLNPGADPEDMVSLRIWVEHDRIITVRLRRLMAVNDVREKIATGNGPVNSSDTLRMLAQGLVQRMAPVIEDMSDEIDSLENDMVENPTADIRHRLKVHRREAIALRRYLAPQREALARVQAENIAWMAPDHRMAFRECADQVARIVEDLDAMRERAAVIQDELANRTAEHMNRNMYTLSVVAALMLPLGVITGMLGMNVGGVPLAENKDGFLVIMILLAAVVALQVLIFRRLKWI
ncbi:zinc transporter ZntB [Thalassospiraceae bacterium LMO-JJ14]|nr:zinc transporter ZntB [Thalassospiraceae bacterium LMO-JJ14]